MTAVEYTPAERQLPVPRCEHCRRDDVPLERYAPPTYYSRALLPFEMRRAQRERRAWDAAALLGVVVERTTWGDPRWQTVPCEVLNRAETLCAECKSEWQGYWRDMWDEYYANRW